MNVIDNNLNDKAFEQGFVRELLYPFYEWISWNIGKQNLYKWRRKKKKISIKFKHLKSAYSLDLYRYTHTYTRIYICIIKSRKREKEIYIFAKLKKKNVWNQRLVSDWSHR